MRSITPRSSRSRNRSSGVAARAAASMMSAAIPRKTTGSGCSTARLNIQGSRGRTQQIASGSTPLPSSQTQASVAVLPGADDDELRGGAAELDQLVDGHDVRPVRDAERRRRRRRDLRGQVAGVDHARARSHLVAAAGHPRHDPAVADVLAARVEGDPSGREHPLAQHLGRSTRTTSGAVARSCRPFSGPSSWMRPPRATSRARRRTRTPGGAGRTGTRRASDPRRRAAGRPAPRATSAWSISASVNAIPAAPAPTTT